MKQAVGDNNVVPFRGQVPSHHVSHVPGNPWMKKSPYSDTYRLCGAIDGMDEATRLSKRDCVFPLPASGINHP